MMTSWKIISFFWSWINTARFRFLQNSLKLSPSLLLVRLLHTGSKTHGEISQRSWKMRSVFFLSGSTQVSYLFWDTIISVAFSSPSITASYQSKFPPSMCLSSHVHGDSGCLRYLQMAIVAQKWHGRTVFVDSMNLQYAWKYAHPK